MGKRHRPQFAEPPKRLPYVAGFDPNNPQPPRPPVRPPPKPAWPAAVVDRVEQLNRRQANSVVPAREVQSKEKWPGLDGLVAADGDGARRVQELLTSFGVGRRDWSDAKPETRKMAVEFARSMLGMTLTLQVAFRPGSFFPPDKAPANQRRALQTIAKVVKQLGRKNTGTRSVQDAVSRHAVALAAVWMLDALVQILESLKTSLKTTQLVADAELANGLSNRLHEVPEIEVGLGHRSDTTPLVKASDLESLMTSSPRTVAIRLVVRAFGPAVTADNLRRRRIKR